jgi:hypothetical protein
MPLAAEHMHSTSQINVLLCAMAVCGCMVERGSCENYHVIWNEWVCQPSHD